MRLKSYFADSVQTAMEKARLELGTEAMLISSQETSQDLKDLGAYEVVFGLAPAASAQIPPVPVETAYRPGQRSASDGSVLAEIAELRRQLEQLGESVGRSSVARATEKFTPELSRHFDRLLNVGFSPEFAQDVVGTAAQRAHSSSAVDPHRMLRDHRDPFARDLFTAVLREEIASRFTVAASLGNDDQSQNAVVFAGPPGAGKTSSLVKLGVEFGLKNRRSLHLWSLDTLRVGHCDQLARYARLLGAEFRPFTDAAVLPQALARCSPGDLVLIDTPGFSRAETVELQDLARLLENLPVEVQLVLPASLHFGAAQKAADRFTAFHPAKLLLTHMEEAVSPACAVEFAARLGLPLSFFGFGQQIPEDIAAADKAALLELLATPHSAAKGVAA